jgi:hypothetical protein
VKYFTAENRDKEDNKVFYTEQYKKMFILYCYILPYYTSGKHEKDDFLKEYAKILDGKESKLQKPDF